MKYKNKIVVKYSITAVSAAIVSLLILYFNGFGKEAELAEKYKMLADAFTIPGVLLMTLATLMWISAEGLFDGIAYALRQFSGFFITAAGRKYKHIRYYDYKAERQGKRPCGYSFLFLVGFVFTLIAIVLIIPFNSVCVPKI